MMNILLDKSEADLLLKILPENAGPILDGILAKIQRANKCSRKNRLHDLNLELRKITGQNYFKSISDFLEPLASLCSSNGIACDISIEPNDSRNFDLGSGIFLSVSTYTMPSGNVEIVSYFHG